MNDTESFEEKKEQELNLFDDQPLPEEDVSAATESTDNLFPAETPESADTVFPEDPAVIPTEDEAQSAENSALPPPEATGIDLRKEDPGNEPESGPVNPATDDSPIVAPPPPRKKPASPRPGIVAPHTAGQATVAPASAAASSPAEDQDPGTPLPHPLKRDQTLGQMLMEIRKERGFSVEEVAAALRIRTDYMRELESDELQKDLQTVYISAYVRKLAEDIYRLRKEDREVLLEKMHVETPEISDKLCQSVNNGEVVDENEKKRERNITIGIYAALGVILLAIIWLIVLAITHYAKNNSTASSAVPGSVQPAETPVSQTILLDETELDALIVPETPSISVLKMSKTPGVRDTP